MGRDRQVTGARQTSASNTAATLALPTALKPTWLSEADFERLDKSDDASNEIDSLDAFVVTVGDSDGNQRTLRVAATALMISLHTTASATTFCCFSAPMGAVSAGESHPTRI
jgi:hypothetical protein